MVANSSVLPGNQTKTASEEDEIDLLALLNVLLNGKWIILSTALVMFVLAVIYVLISTPIYQSNAVVQVEQKEGAMPNLDALGQMLNGGGGSESETEIQLIKSRSVVGKSIDQLQLDITVKPTYFPLIGKAYARHFKPTENEKINAPFLGFSSYAWGGEKIKVSRFSVPSEMEGKIFYLRYLGDNNFELLNSSDEIILKGKVGESINNNGFNLLVTQLQARENTEFEIIKHNHLNTVIFYQKHLSVSEQGKDSGILSLSYNDKSPNKANAFVNAVARNYVRQNVERRSAEAAKSLEFLKGHLPDVKRQLEAAEQKLANYQSHSRSVDISAEAEAVLNQIVNLETRISELQLKRAEVERLYTPQHPIYRALVEQLNKLKSQKSELEKRVGGLPKTQQQVLRLKRDVAVSTEIYTELLNKVQELDVARAGTVGNVRIIDTAATDLTNPVKPKKSLIVVVATMLGFIIGIGWVLFKIAINRGIKSPAELEAIGLSVFATIPHSPNQVEIDQRSSRDIDGNETRLLAINNSNDLAIEALRGLRTSLHFVMMDSKNNILMFTGPSPKIGKSFVSANFAVLCAEAGQKVLLIDADMRKGYLQRFLNLQWDEGLSELIAGDIDKSTAIKQTEVEKLSFIPRGQIPPNPAELLMHERFKELLDWADKNYDLVIIDTPPVMAVTDSTIIGQLAGTTIVLSRFGLNPVDEVKLMLGRLNQNGVKVKGSILNGISKSHGYGDYGYYHYEYSSK